MATVDEGGKNERREKQARRRQQIGDAGQGAHPVSWRSGSWVNGGDRRAHDVRVRRG